MPPMGSHPAGWLFPDLRPFWDTTRPDLPFADCHWQRKETTMTTTKTATNAKENTMNESTKMSYADRSNARIAARVELQQTIQAEVKEPGIPEVTHILPGKTAANLCDDPVEIELLRYAAAYYGWTDTAYCTAAQAKRFDGTVKEGAQGFDLIWLPKTTKTGKNAGVTTQHVATVYPASAFEWAYGSPNDHAYKVKKAQKELRKAQRNLNAAEREGTTKTDLKQQNDALQAQLKAQAEQMAQMQAMMAQLMAKIA